MPLKSRNTALFILNKLNKGNVTLDNIIDKVFDEKNSLSKQDKALANAIVYGVTRWRGLLDWVINYFSKTPIKKIHPNILNILRIGIFQIWFLDRIPNSAAVDTSVKMAKSFAPYWVIKYVNGLLRNVSREVESGLKNISFPNIEDDPVEAIIVSKSFPKWLITRWLKRYGLDETLKLCDTINQIPCITIRTNTLKTNRQTLIDAIYNDVSNISKTEYSPDGVCFDHPKTSIPEMEPFKNGWFQVQDEAAQLVSLLCNPQPGERILDACAGLGGKTTHIAQLMDNKGQIIALDHDKLKLGKLKTELKRLGISNVITYEHDLHNPLDANKLKQFDKILLDAPCSGLGVLRRNPDSKWSNSKQNLIRYQKRQLLFLNNLTTLLKPSGSLTYCVCSTEPEETDDVIKYFLKKHPNFYIDKHINGLSKKILSLVNKQGYFKSSPYINNMDGFFAVTLKSCKLF